MRLDKYIAKAQLISRSHAKKLIRSGWVLVDDVAQKSTGLIVNENQVIQLKNQILTLVVNQYILLNKPKGTICSSKDEEHPTALNCLNIKDKANLHFAGRLDQDTTGLVLMSNDGQWTHRITSPKHKQAKTYLVTLTSALSIESIKSLESGVLLKDSDKPTLPAQVEVVDELKIKLTLTEGRYHQVKRMLVAVGNHVTELHRLSIGRVTIGDTLKIGEWRYLTQEEIEFF